MRELSNLEISSISAGEKAISDMTPTDFLPYAAAAGACWWVVGFVGTYGQGENALNQHAVYALQTVGGIGGLVGGWLVAKFVNENVTPFM